MKANIDQIRPIAEQIKTGRDLMGFAGKSESELMICQTLYGSLSNHKKGKGAYSIKKLNPDGGLVKNSAGYKLCLDRGWFEEDKCESEIRIYPTVKLIKALEKHL